MNNPVGALQERFQGRGVMPVYSEAAVVGPSHAPYFTITVTVLDKKAVGTGSNKKEAKTKAAAEMIKLLDGQNRQTPTTTTVPQPVTSARAGTPPMASSIPSSTRPRTATPPQGPSSQVSVQGNAIGQLQEFCVAQKYPMPLYGLENQIGGSHCPEFTVACRVGQHETVGVASTKQIAKNEAAANMVRLLNGDGGNQRPSASRFPPSATSSPSRSSYGFDRSNTASPLPDSDTSSNENFQEARSSEGSSASARSPPRSPSKIGKLFKGLDKSRTLSSLRDVDLDDQNVNAQEALDRVAAESNFSFHFAAVGNHLVTGRYIALVQVHQNEDRIFISRGAGCDKESAEKDAAATVLEYLRLMTGDEHLN